MKKTSLLSILFIFLLLACNNNAKQGEEAHNETEIQPLAIEEVLEMAAENVGKEVYFQGVVSHVCTHSGKRCILVDSTGNLSLRVEATGEIKGFNRELSGSRLAVHGTIQEKRLTAQYIDDWEKKLKEDNPNVDIEKGGEQCAAELSNIASMRNWMKENNKDYYSTYFINGIDYEVLE